MKLSGAFFLGFLLIAATTGALCLRPTLAGTETPSATDILRGAWQPKFESSLREVLPVSAASRDAWGRAEFALFHEGRKGVIAGKDGWLFTDEEFSCPKSFTWNFRENLDFIAQTQKKMREAGAKLVIVLIPAKSRLFGVDVPGCRASLYDDIRARIAAPVTDLLPVMRDRTEFFFKSDTHWTPAGSRLAAEEAAKLAHVSEGQEFKSVSSGSKAHAGDLLRYVPGVAFPSETFAAYTTESASGGDLLGDAPVPRVALVGTSYSANKDWNFAGFLKESLRADVLNVASEGQGPFAVMRDYLASEEWKSAPPRLVVWEMPERYFLSPL